MADHLVHQSENLRFTEVFDELHAYASFHFDAEERIWREHFEDDNWMRWHQKSHSDFIDGISSLISDYANNSYDEILERVIKFLTHWLAFHILESDRRMAKSCSTFAFWGVT